MNALGDFLRARRAALAPEDLGVVSHNARRVPGLRREELAQLAGVSPAYYTRLEQGQSTGASDAVLDALATALRLTPDERAHLHTLARPVPRRRAATRRSRLSDPMRALATTITDQPLVVLDRRFDVLAWNRLGHALLAGHLAADAPDTRERPNLLRLLFTDAHTRDLYPDRETETKRAVASARLAAGAGEDAALAALVGELAIASPEFATLWARHPVAACLEGTKRFHHPVAGPMTLWFTTTSGEGGQRVLLSPR